MCFWKSFNYLLYFINICGSVGGSDQNMACCFNLELYFFIASIIYCHKSPKTLGCCSVTPPALSTKVVKAPTMSFFEKRKLITKLKMSVSAERQYGSNIFTSIQHQIFATLGFGACDTYWLTPHPECKVSACACVKRDVDGWEEEQREVQREVQRGAGEGGWGRRGLTS